jgi:hypothetical protein
MTLHTGLEIDSNVNQYTSLFESIAQDIAVNGYSIKPNALPVELAKRLSARSIPMLPQDAKSARQIVPIYQA